MDKASELNLEKTYNAIRKSCPTTLIDSFEAVREVEAYRQFWKPNRTNIVLLAESHVYTDQADFDRQLKQKYMQQILPGYPSHFVRFVYCLGYGENSLLDREGGKRLNTGTPQFWKIFSYCAAKNPDNPQDYKVLKNGTPNGIERMQNKIVLLQRLKERGIWLMDASIVGLYGNEAKSEAAAYQKIIDICWNNYVEDQIRSAQPKYVIVIGKGVASIVAARLRVSHEIIDLPTAHKTKEELLEDFKSYSEICNAVFIGEPVPTKGKAEELPLISSAADPFILDRKLYGLGYLPKSEKEWSKGDRTIYAIKSREFGQRVRVMWKEFWADSYAIVFDYSGAGGPLCVVTSKALFESKFIREKRKTEAYRNSGYAWSQVFPVDHELPQLILAHKNRWDLL